MIENRSTVSETCAKPSGEAKPERYSPDEVSFAQSAPEKQTDDPLRQQISQLLAGPQGDFKLQGVGPQREITLEGGVGPDGELRLNGKLNAGDWEVRARFESGKYSFTPQFAAQMLALTRNLQNLGDESLKTAGLKAMHDAEDRIFKHSLPTRELEGVYSQVNQLLSNPSSQLSDKERANIAVGILHHTGQGRIDQGMHSTCNVTVLQNIAFDQRPSLAAEMITSAALTGEWKAGDGKVIRVPKESMKPGFEEEKFPPEDALRSHASQIFQVVALNDVGQREANPKEYVQKEMGIGSLFYALGDAYLPWSEYWMPNGYEVWRDGRGNETQFLGLTGKQIQEESQRLFGDKFDTISYKSPYEWLSHPWTADPNDYKLTKTVESEDGLRQTLTKLDADGRLPVVVAVNGNKIVSNYGVSAWVGWGLRALIRPVKTAHEAIDGQLGISNHVVTVTKFDKAFDRVYVKNSWGKDQDGWVSVKDLWKAV